MDNNYEIDYKAMLDRFLEQFKLQYENEIEYFSLMRFVSENLSGLDNISVISKNLLQMRLADQLNYLRLIKATIDISKELVDKYKFEPTGGAEE